MRRKGEKKRGKNERWGGRQGKREERKRRTQRETDRHTDHPPYLLKYISLSGLFSLWLPQKHSKDFNARPHTIST